MRYLPYHVLAVPKDATSFTAFVYVSDLTSALEWIGHRLGTRAVTVTMDPVKASLLIRENGEPARIIDLSGMTTDQSAMIILSADVNMKMMMINVPNYCSLVVLNLYVH